MSLLWTLFLLSSFFLFRVYSVLKSSSRVERCRRSMFENCSVAIFLGSGGHTSEMLTMLSTLDHARYSPRLYITSEGDFFSARKAIEFEIEHNPSAIDLYPAFQIPRARRVHQSLLSTPPTALRSLLYCLKLVSSPALKRNKPLADLLLMNGPGTCFTLCFAILMCRILGLSTPRTIYIESFTRVSSLSLAGRLVRPLVDRFVVQWPSSGRSHEYEGWLV